MSEFVVAFRTPLPCEVPPGGRAVVLVEGRVTEDGVQGPGRIEPTREWRGKEVCAVVFPAASFSITFELENLRTAEDVSLGLAVKLSLCIEEPIHFLVGVVRDKERLASEELAALLRDAVRTGLGKAIRRRSLEELDSDPNLRSWLGTPIEAALQDEVDLLKRYGLELLGVEAFDLHCTILDQAAQVRERYYLKATLAREEAAGRKLLDEQVLSILRGHLPIKEELIEKKERLAEMEEREAAVDMRVMEARRQRQERLRRWLDAWAHPPSSLRPELWRLRLGKEVLTAPLCDEKWVYIASRDGEVMAFRREDGEPAWPQPAWLEASPGDGMALAGGHLLIPAHDGSLYALDPITGAVRRRLEIGGRLSSPPLVSGDLAYLSVDVDAKTLRPGFGDVVAVDLKAMRVLKRWKVSRRGLRARPSIWGDILFVGDRGGGFHALDLRTGRVEGMPLRLGRVLASALVDEERGQVIVAGSFGLVALEPSGRERWKVRLGGGVVGSPLLHRGVLYVGAADGNLYILDPATGEEVLPPFATKGPIAAPPVGWEDFVFISSNDGYLYAVDTETGTCFWQYYSGSPIPLPPAVTPEGTLYVVDKDGKLNALRWCLARFGEAARRAEALGRWMDAAELWLLAGEQEGALEAAERAGRLDLAAELAAVMGFHARAARHYQALALRSTRPERRALWWAEAAVMWEARGERVIAERCRREEAHALEMPLLRLEGANLPVLVAGQKDMLQVRVINESEKPAYEVMLMYEGHVREAGERPLGSLEPFETRLVSIEVEPTETGSAMVRVGVRYRDAKGRLGRPVRLDMRLKVAQPPQVHHHYHGPVITGDGVIIMRGTGVPSGRTISVHG